MRGPMRQGLPLDWKSHYDSYTLIGVDEVGTGCIAGPVAAAACAINPYDGWAMLYAVDSKMFGSGGTAKMHRAERAEEIKRRAYHYAIRELDVEDAVGPRRTSDQTMAEAVMVVANAYAREHPQGKPLLVIVDGERRLNIPLQQVIVKKADVKFICVGAASIIAKDYRDRLMYDYAQDPEYRGYGFDIHAGYASPQHLIELHARGLCDLHRKRMADATLRRYREKLTGKRQKELPLG